MMEATMATMTTRTYCMKATSRASAPYASAITIMADAAPGNNPQMAVVSGKMRNLLMIQPSTQLATMTSRLVVAGRAVYVAIGRDVDDHIVAKGGPHSGFVRATFTTDGP